MEVSKKKVTMREEKFKSTCDCIPKTKMRLREEMDCCRKQPTQETRLVSRDGSKRAAFDVADSQEAAVAQLTP